MNAVDLLLVAARAAGASFRLDPGGRLQARDLDQLPPELTANRSPASLRGRRPRRRASRRIPACLATARSRLAAQAMVARCLLRRLRPASDSTRWWPPRCPHPPTADTDTVLQLRTCVRCDPAFSEEKATPLNAPPTPHAADTDMVMRLPVATGLQPSVCPNRMRLPPRILAGPFHHRPAWRCLECGATPGRRRVDPFGPPSGPGPPRGGPFPLSASDRQVRALRLATGMEPCRWPHPPRTGMLRSQGLLRVPNACPSFRVVPGPFYDRGAWRCSGPVDDR